MSLIRQYLLLMSKLNVLKITILISIQNLYTFHFFVKTLNNDAFRQKSGSEFYFNNALN